MFNLFSYFFSKTYRKKVAFFKRCQREFQQQTNVLSNVRFRIDTNNLHPCLDDNTTYTEFDAHYTYHTAWAARILSETKPELHIDISSSLYFCSIASAFTPIHFYDYRPAQLNLSNLSSSHADVVNLHFPSNSIHSLSCMHTVEHIGLGRYGDPIDPDGDLKAISELKRVTAPMGNLLFVVPIAEKSVLQYNAHRIYSYDMIMEYFTNFSLRQFALVKDDSSFILHATKNDIFNQRYACGCFWFVKNK